MVMCHPTCEPNRATVLVTEPSAEPKNRLQRVAKRLVDYLEHAGFVILKGS
jgi:hypothetical protein